MNYSRRDFSFLVSSLLAVNVNATPGKPPLASKTYAFDNMPVRKNGPNSVRSILDGATRTGFPIELHMTELAPGQAPHPPHRHVHEEMIMIRDGMLEVTIAGRSARLDSGSVAYVASNEEHGWRNVGAGRALYFVLALGRDS
jgi:quercetin dioxygenase-like cupin family protein